MACACLCAAAAACGSPPPTGIVVSVQSDLRVPAEINRLLFRAWKLTEQGPEPLGEERAFDLVSDRRLAGAGGLTLPAEFGIQNESGSSERVMVEAVGQYRATGGAVVDLVSRKAVLSFRPALVKEVVLHFSFECATRKCPPGTTCVPGYGCVDPAVNLETGAPVAHPNGPACDRNSLFPMCVGASWRYCVLDSSTNNPLFYWKSWVIADFGPIPDERHGKDRIEAFLQYRQSAIDRSQRWVQYDRDQGTVTWHRDEWFDSDWQPTVRRYYLPSKMRVWGSPPEPVRTWPYLEEVDWLAQPPPGRPRKEVIRHVDEWQVVDPARLPGYPAQFANPVCQRRDDSVPDTQTKKTATFCFVRGIGKVYELTANAEEEWLVEWNVPGSSKNAYPELGRRCPTR